jgi:hypothetical protein
MLTECRNMGLKKHTVKLHCSLNSINEDEYTILQRSFENVLALRVDVRENSLVNSQSVKTDEYSLIELQFSDMIDFLQTTV